MIFDIYSAIHLYNSKGTLQLFLSLPFVCEYPHRYQKNLLNIYLKNNDLK